MDFQEFIAQNYGKNEFVAKMYINHPVKKTHTYCYKTEALAKEYRSNEENLYMALNPLCFLSDLNGGKNIKRDKCHVSKLKWLYADVDTYNTPFNKQQVLMNLEENHFNRTIPRPTHIIDSGRGMYLLWKLSDEHIKALPRWEKVQKYIYSVLKEFGADDSVTTDTARVLRAIGSINSKSGSEVKVVDHYNYEYTLYEITQEYLPATIADKIKPKKKSKVTPINTLNSMLTARLKDLETLLLKFRDKANSCREKILFLYRYWSLCISGDKQDSLESIVELNSRLKNPLDDTEVIRATKSAEKYFDEETRFKMTNGKVIEFIGITDEEMKEMKTLISFAEKCLRKAWRDRKAYLRKLEEKGETTKAEKIIKRLFLVYKMMKSKKKSKEIAKKLEVSIRTAQNDMKTIREMSSNEIAKLVGKISVFKNAEKQAENSLKIENAKNSAFVLEYVVQGFTSEPFRPYSGYYGQDINRGEYNSG